MNKRWETARRPVGSTHSYADIYLDMGQNEMITVIEKFYYYRKNPVYPARRPDKL